jgi:hypothetical protein
MIKNLTKSGNHLIEIEYCNILDTIIHYINNIIFSILAHIP